MTASTMPCPMCQGSGNIPFIGRQRLDVILSRILPADGQWYRISAECKADSAAVQGYRRACVTVTKIESDQPHARYEPSWNMLDSGTYVWDAEKRTLTTTTGIVSPDATVTVVRASETPIPCDQPNLSDGLPIDIEAAASAGQQAYYHAPGSASSLKTAWIEVAKAMADTWGLQWRRDKK